MIILNFEKSDVTKTLKYVVSCCDPYYNGWCTRAEVKAAKVRFWGKFFDEFNVSGYETFCSFNKRGRRHYFEYEYQFDSTWKEAKQLARKWAKGSR